jgi:hypothetical protein
MCCGSHFKVHLRSEYETIFGACVSRKDGTLKIGQALAANELYCTPPSCCGFNVADRIQSRLCDEGGDFELPPEAFCSPPVI